MFTFSEVSPPTEYVTVNVVFDGTNPYVLVYKKLLGSISVDVVRDSKSRPNPTFFGFGINSSSAIQFA